MNVEEYRYDYAGNRIAKIGELSTTYYLVDTNGALSQVLAEYDENSSLKTYYTRGEELISQERNGAKSYYIYDGFDSVRMLTDENGSATDFYTYDAFGNLTEQTGDTENDFLYRGEQYDSFTGLYYLRARYMNPSTGTFITMDEYAGSVFEPVSLHKYLYANANPVMYSDPSGYFSLGGLSASISIQGVLNSMECGAVLGGFLNSLLTALRGGTTEEIQLALLEGFVSGAIFGGAFGIIGSWAATYWQARILLAAMESVAGYFAFRNAIIDFANGHIGAGVIDTILGFAASYSAASNARAAGRMYGGNVSNYTIPNKPHNNSSKPPMGVDDFLEKYVPKDFREDVRSAFKDDAKVTTLDKDMKVYRYHGNGSKPISFWFTTEQTSNPKAVLALPPGNSCDYCDTHIIPKGTTILEGTVAPRYGQPGEGYQIYVPNPEVVRPY